MGRALRVWTTTGLLYLWLTACSGETGTLTVQSTSSCMRCHNGSLQEDYAGPGIENPHPFGDATSNALGCTDCHGGDPNGEDELAAHVPPPPQIGDRTFQTTNRLAYFNRLTLAGIDKFPDYNVDGRTYSAIDYLQFINPGDLRVVNKGRSCGTCHENHVEDVESSLLATEAGILSGARYAIGAPNPVPESIGLHADTAAGYSVRAVSDSSFSPTKVGTVGRLLEYPVYSVRNDTGPDAIFNNPDYFAANVDLGQNADGTVVAGSPLEHLYHEQVAFTCGDCHLGSAGANNRAGDFRSSGCSACHMPYSLGGRAGSSDPNVNKLEPLDPDDIDEPERPHLRTHRIHSVAKTLPGGVTVPGIDDLTCAGCHQGSNRTVMQFWGIRLDQNADVVSNRQYPANPASRRTTANDTRLFDPVLGNQTFNGRRPNQYLEFEDYDGDGRDDTPADVHHEAGLGCIDCHGSYDLHGGDATQAGTEIFSRMEQQVAIRCESCHGTIDAYAATTGGQSYDGVTRQLAMDAEGHGLRNVWQVSPGEFWLKSRLTGAMHYVPQTRDVVVSNGKTRPGTTDPIYNALASYAMGRVDGDAGNGTGPKQDGGVTPGFSHTDRMDCASCHSSWTNTCMGCHLSGEYDNGQNFSNITGERIVFKQRTADFVYQSPLFFQLGVSARGKIQSFSANTKVFFQWEDGNQPVNGQTDFFQFSDRNGGGNNPGTLFPSLSHNAFMAHSIRGKVSTTNEGPRYCVACHLTDQALTTYSGQYSAFRSAMSTGDFAALDFDLLKTHFGRNTGNQMNSPFFPHMVAGLGTGLFLFDPNGAPVNRIDTFAGRIGAGGQAPSTVFDAARVTLNLDRIVEASGASTGSNNHTWLTTAGPLLRDGCLDDHLAGPLGASLIRRLADPSTGIVLDSWIDANGAPQGSTTTYLSTP